MAQYILALDQGTTSSRAIVFGQDGRSVSRAQRPIRQIYPQPGWVEHDPREIVETQIEVAREALAQAGLSANAIAAVGITNQRETTVVWDRDTGAPVHNAIVWQCRRTAPDCDGLREKGLEPLVRDRTGLLLDAYFSATKVAWILDHVPGARARAEAGELLMGTIDSWLIWNLTGGAVHATDPSNASRTMLMQLGAEAWDPELAQLLGVPPPMLPEIRPSSGNLGTVAPEILGAPVPIASAIGDQQSALFGHGCLTAGAAKVTYGTGCFALVNVETPVRPPRGLVTSAAWSLGGETRYALEGSVFVAGAAVQWLRDELGLIGSADETESLARSVADTCGAYLVPAFVGLGAPHWDPTARGALVGLTRGVGRAHLARACLEAIAYQTADVLEAMAEGSQLRLEELHVDGGASANDWLMQFQSDIIGIPVVRSEELETTARGAAFLAGLAVGLWESPEAVAALCAEGKRFEPEMAPADRRRLRVGWNRAVERARGWAL